MVAVCEGLHGLESELWRTGSAEPETVMAEADRVVAAGGTVQMAEPSLE